MAFRCNNCRKRAGNLEMAGLVIGQLGRDLLVAWGIIPDRQRASAESIAGKLTAGLINGFGISCPRCGRVDWDHTENRG